MNRRFLVRSGCVALSLLFLVACSESNTRPQQAETPAEPPLPAKAKVIIQTDMGKMTCALFPGDAPRNVGNFIGLAEGTREWEHPLNHRMIKMKLYDGTSFHRVISGFMIQGGDPAGNGAGGPGYHVVDEITPKLKFDRAGRLAMANEGPNTNGSQFFITVAPTPHLDGRFTIIGQCDDASVEVAKKIAAVPRDRNDDRPKDPPKIRSVTIVRGS